MDLNSFLPNAVNYLQTLPINTFPGWSPDTPFKIQPLAQGEYNMNYIVQQAGCPDWVLRINVGSQIHRDDQICYEFNTLRLLEASHHTPLPLFVDDSRAKLNFGVLGMTYLHGVPLNYRVHSLEAAKLFANLHEYSSHFHETHLIQENTPLSMTYQECSELLPTYFDSELADPAIQQFLKEVLDWANQARAKEKFFTADPIPCVINTEVNSSNFIFQPDTHTLFLVDWEKPLWGDPSQDLSHFCVPTTTLWKTEYQMTPQMKSNFLATYQNNLKNQHLKDTIIDRVRLRDPFNCLRGISWSAMAWVSYQTGEAVIKNQDTYQKLCHYMNIDFIRSLFEPFLNRS
jgi:thiamine kinase-like enzyme